MSVEKEKLNIVVTVEKKEYDVIVEKLNGRGKISNSTGLMKGDLIAFKSSGNPVRLPVGVSGKVLTADPLQETGMRWADVGNLAGSTTLLHNELGSTLAQGTIVTLIPEDQILEEREVTKALKFCDQKLFFVKEDTATGQDVECFHIPGTICQVLVTGTCSYLDPLVVSSTAGVAEALPTGTPTVGYALEAKASSATGLVNVLLVENKTIGICNTSSASQSNGVVYTYSGGKDTDGFGLTYLNVRPASYGDMPCGVQANYQTLSNTLGVMHHKEGEIAYVTCDAFEVDEGDWLVPSDDDPGMARYGIGYGIGTALESKEAGSSGKVKAILHPFSNGVGPKRFMYYLGNMSNTEWNKSLVFRTTADVDYTMKQLENDGKVLTGSITGTGTEERCIYVRSKSIDLTNFSKMVILYKYKTVGSIASTIRDVYLGVADPDVSTVKQTTISNLLKAYYNFTPSPNTDTLYSTQEINISSLTGYHDVVALWAQDNLNGTIELDIKWIYLK